MLTCRIVPYRLHFRFAARTSRDTLLYRDTYYIIVGDTRRPGVTGIGECALFRGLGDDDTPGYGEELMALARRVEGCSDAAEVEMPRSTSMRFGLETALADLANGGVRTPFPGPWSGGRGAIVINGLIWMGSEEEMLGRIRQKLDAGFKCLKLKIGGIDFGAELRLLHEIRRRFPAELLELRVDANGAFGAGNVMQRLEALERFGIHSIEQPVAPRQWDLMARVCRESPVPVALDEELIGVHDAGMRRRMLEVIRPAFVILKPSLCGGFAAADDWISAAGELGTGWWATSALESNVGLNAIAQWVSCYTPSMPQGLGTGQLYLDNIPSPLELRGDRLVYNTSGQWDLSAIS